MTANILPLTQDDWSVAISSKERTLDLQIGQERIYGFLVEIVKHWTPEEVLQEFKRLFIEPLNAVNIDSISGIYGIFEEYNELEFRHTLKRCCYILVNNWEHNRKHKYIQDLVDLLEKVKSNFKPNNEVKIRMLRRWLINFIDSHDYQELKLFLNRAEEESKTHWANRYTSYLLVAQSANRNNPKEQQEAAIKRSQDLKDKFKFDLAMYIARSQSSSLGNNHYKNQNPTILGDDVLRLIKAIVVKKGEFSYENIAHIFLKQTDNQSLYEFKNSLQKYLIYFVQPPEIVDNLNQILSEKLSIWKKEYNHELMGKELLLRACNKTIDFLTTENGNEPSSLFVLLLSQGHSLTLVVLLLKIIMISRNSRRHLELRIAHLIRYYDKFPVSECEWVINFIEVFNITLAIYAENVEYSLIKMKEEEKSNIQPALNLDGYRVFSQLKLDS
jgi:hypothetical protein